MMWLCPINEMAEHFVACQHLISVTNVYECEDQS
jgi:hypothetical protein